MIENDNLMPTTKDGQLVDILPSPKRLMDEFREHNSNITKDYPMRRLVKNDGNLCEFIAPGINIMATHNIKDFAKIVLLQASIAKLESDDTRNGKLIYFDIGNEVGNNDITDIAFSINEAAKYTYEIFKCTLVEDIFNSLKERIEMNSTIVITGFEKMTFQDMPDVEPQWISTTRAKILTQFFKRLIPILANNNSLLIIGHSSEEYINYTSEWNPYTTQYKKVTNKPVPEVPFGTMLWLSDTVNKLTNLHDNYCAVECIKNIINMTK